MLLMRTTSFLALFVLLSGPLLADDKPTKAQRKNALTVARIEAEAEAALRLWAAAVDAARTTCAEVSITINAKAEQKKSRRFGGGGKAPTLQLRVGVDGQVTAETEIEAGVAAKFYRPDICQRPAAKAAGERKAE